MKQVSKKRSDKILSIVTSTNLYGRMMQVNKKKTKCIAIKIQICK